MFIHVTATKTQNNRSAQPLTHRKRSRARALVQMEIIITKHTKIPSVILLFLEQTTKRTLSLLSPFSLLFSGWKDYDVNSSQTIASPVLTQLRYNGEKKPFQKWSAV